MVYSHIQLAPDDLVAFLNLKPDTDSREFSLSRMEIRYILVIVASPIPDSVAVLVEREQRHKQHVWNDNDVAVGVGHRGAKGGGKQLLTGPPGVELHGPLLNGGQTDLVPPVLEHPQDGLTLYLAVDGVEPAHPHLRGVLVREALDDGLHAVRVLLVHILLEEELSRAGREELVSPLGEHLSQGLLRVLHDFLVGIHFF